MTGSHEAPVAAMKRPRGRPRRLPQTVIGDPREQILQAAARLFTTKGYSGTGTREIATAVGLEQPSLFHWFRRKEDIFAELLDRTVSPALAASDLLDACSSNEQRLYVLARRDVGNLVAGAVNLAALQLLPEARAPEFAQFWVRREELRQRYCDLIKGLADEKRLVLGDTELATSVVFGLVESVITWYERGGELSRDSVADSVALSVVRSCVVRPSSERTLRSAAQAVLPELSPPG